MLCVAVLEHGLWHAGVPAMRRREVIVHQPMGAVTGQVTALPDEAQHADSTALSVPAKNNLCGGRHCT